MVDAELFRGAIASLVASMLSNLMNMFGTHVLKLHIEWSSLFFISIFGNLLGYSLDILFAKKYFYGKEVPYSDMPYRLLWWMKSFSSPIFFKFIVTIIIDMILFTVLLRTILKTLDEKEIKFKYRDVLVAAAVTTVTFVLYVNYLRFKWAYLMKTSPIMDMVILAWSGLSMILFFMFTKNEPLLKKVQ